jgi:putative ABC transport system substrate-binding protein
MSGFLSGSLSGNRQSAIQNPKWIALSLLGFALVVAGAVAEAQQATKIPRIGYLTAASFSSSSMAVRTEAFRQALRALGYIEGKNILIDERYAEGKLDRLPALAIELIRLNVDIIVSTGPRPTRSAKEATSTIPIVMAQDTDPVGNGFVASLARPGGNITGLSLLSPELSGKRLEILTEIVPKLSRMAVFGTSTYPGNAQSLKEAELAAAALGVKLRYLDVLNSNGIEPAFRAATQGQADAILVLGGPAFNAQRPQIAELAIKSRLPAMYFATEFVQAGGLMSYGVSFTDLFRRAATYVDKILKDAQAGDLPVEQPTKFELVVNLKTAKQIGLTVSPNVLTRADRVIK